MRKYEPRQVPFELSDLMQFLYEELQRISDATGAQTILQLQVTHVEPEKVRDGMIVLADGTNWNPGSGAGYYGYHSNAWNFLG